MLKIIGKASSINVRKVLWTCAELGIGFERRDWDAGDAAFNPNAMVPIIIDGDFVLWESNTICRYLCNKMRTDHLLPSEPQARAHVEQWMDWQATELNTAWRYAFMGLVRGSPAHANPEQIAASIARWNRHIGILERRLATTGGHVAGEHFSLADVVLGLSVHRWVLMPMDRPHYPAVHAYYERLCERCRQLMGAGTVLAPAVI